MVGFALHAERLAKAAQMQQVAEEAGESGRERVAIGTTTRVVVARALVAVAAWVGPTGGTRYVSLRAVAE